MTSPASSPAAATGSDAGRPKRRPGVFVPAALIDDERIRLAHLSVLIVMARYANRQGVVARLRQGTIGKKLGRSRPWVNAVIAELEEFGLVEQVHQATDGFMRSSEYRIVYPGWFEAQEVAANSDTGCRPAVTDLPDEDLEKNLSPQAGDDANRFRQRESVGSPGSTARAHHSVVGDGWMPSAETLAWAQALSPGADVRRFTLKFVNLNRAKGYRYASHDAAWRAWFLEALEKGGVKHECQRGGAAGTAQSAAPGRGRNDVRSVNQRIARDALGRIMARRAVVPDGG
jgi:hypothetical protein